MNSHWSALHADALEQIFKEFTRSNIEWLVIRNYHGLPYVNCSKDVDIAIKKSDWDRSSQIVKDVLGGKGFCYYDLKQYQYIKCYTFFDLNGNGFKIDFFDCNEYAGLKTHTFDQLYRDRVCAPNEVWGSSELHNSIIVFERPLLGGGIIKKKYIAEIEEYYKIQPTAFKQELAHVFSSQLSEKICAEIESGRIESTTKYRSQLNKKLLANNIKQYGIKACWAKINHYFTTFKVRMKMMKTTPFIAVLGSDGSGKSTFIDSLILSLSKYYAVDPQDKVSLYHHRPTLLPNLGELGEKANVMTADKNFTDPHRAKPAGFISSLCRMTYYWLDYLIGGFYVRIKDVNADKVTIFDRYIYDMLIDPRRTRINLPYWLRALYTRLVPQPKVVFILLTSADIIYRRKQELTLEEIQRQLGELEKLSKSSKRFVVLNAAKSPEELTSEAAKIIFERFSKQI